MRIYLTTVIIVIISLTLFIGYNHGLLDERLPIDEEQQGLSEQITIHFSHVVAENTPKGQAVIKFAQLVEQRSHDQIHVAISPNGMQFNDTDEVQALKDNRVQMIAPTFSKMTEEAPSWSVLDLPYLFQNEREVSTILNGHIGQQLLNNVDDPSIKALAFWQNGFKQMINEKQPIIKVEQFKDLYIRSMPSPVLSQQFKAVNAIPVNKSFDEVLTDSSTLKMNAMENTLSNIYSKRFYEKEPYITLSNHGILGYAVLINEDFWQSLSQSNQLIIEQAMKDVTDWNIKNAEKINQDALHAMNNLNLPIHKLNKEEKLRWQQAFQIVYTHFNASESAPYLYEIEQALNRH